MATKKAFQEFAKEQIDKVVQQVSDSLAVEYARQNVKKARTTIGEFVEQMQADGAWENVKNLTFGDLLGDSEAPARRGRPRGRPPGRPAGTKPAARPAGEKKSRRGRMTKAEKAKLMEEIPAFLAKNPGSGASDIAAGIGVDKTRLSGPLKELLESGAISKKGQRRGTTYSAAGGASKARTSAKKKKTAKKGKETAKKGKKGGKGKN